MKRDPETTSEAADRALTIRDASTLSFLLQTAEELNATLQLDDVLGRVAERLKTFVSYDTLAVLLLDPLGTELRFHFGIGFSEDVLSHWRFGLGQGIVGTAARTCKPVLVSDVRHDSRYIDAAQRTGSELAVPLIAKQRTIGVLDVQSEQPGSYTEYHQRLLSFLAGHLANAIENARLYQKLQEQARAQSLMTEAARELTAILDLDTLMYKLAALVKRFTNYQLFSVMLWNEETQLLEHSFSLKFDERFTKKSGFPLGHGITGTSAALRQPLRIPNVQLDPRFVNCGHGVEVRSELVVPLVFKDRLIGVVDLESVDYNAFGEQHEAMLSALGSYIAIAIENARLYERVRRDEQRLAQDLETAREIQKRLLPEAAPHVAGLDVGAAYRPARQLGGDFYDFLPYGDGRLAVTVGDVAGKAAAAALQGSLAIGLLREHVLTHPCPPEEMLAHMNRQLLEPRIDNRFVALEFAVFDVEQRKLTIGNAGFPRPIRVRDGRVEEIPVQGIPLGLMADSRYEQREVELRPGDLVVMCSDGLHECANIHGEEFGKRRLQALIVEHADEAAQAIADRLLRSTDLHNHAAEALDDRTVVVVKYTG